MRIKAECETIEEIGDFFIDEGEELEKNVNDILKLMEELGQYWEGEDFNVYSNNATSNIENITNTAIEFNAFGNAIKKASGVYKEVDNLFYNKMKRMMK